MLDRVLLLSLKTLLFVYSRHAGRRIGDYLDKIVPIVVQFSMIESDDELRECCIQVSFFYFIQQFVYD